MLAASFFWDRVAQHHSYATGGHGLAEYFGPPDQLSPRVDGRTCESCNDYNMLKLTRRLFSFRPDAFYADFHERALFNHVLASIDPSDGRTSYMVPVGRGVQQEYQDMQRDFTCCVGTGMESHALHGDGIYYESADTIWVNLFVPSTAQFTLGRRTLEMETGFPDGDNAKITLTMPSPKEFTLAVRRPSWAGDGFAVKVNGAAVPQPPLASLRAGAAGGRNMRRGRSRAAAELVRRAQARVEERRYRRAHAAQDCAPRADARQQDGRRRSCGVRSCSPAITVRVAKAARRRPTRPFPCSSPATARRRLARVRRPAGELSRERRWRGCRRTPARRDGRVARAVLSNASPHVQRLLRRAHAGGVRRPRRGARRRARTHASSRSRDDRVRAAGRDAAGAGFQLSERAERSSGRNARTVVANRGGTGWFSFDLPVDPSTDMAVVVTYFNELGLPPAVGNFDIQIDGTTIAHFAPNATATGFYDAQYAVPANLVSGKTKATVRFQALGNGRIAPVFGVRMIRSREV